MFQFLYAGMPNPLNTPSWISDAIRMFISMFDEVVYSGVSFMFEVFFRIVDQEIISPDLISDMILRIQVVFGILMIFRLAISLLQVIINPDQLTDKKNGFGGIILRILIMLVLFVSVLPLRNIPDNGDPYNKQIRDNGLLFGTMFSLQNRILYNNVLEKLILGDGFNLTGKNSKKSNSSDDEMYSQYGTLVAAYVLKAFIAPHADSEGNMVCGKNEQLDKEMSPLAEGLTAPLKLVTKGTKVITLISFPPALLLDKGQTFKDIGDDITDKFQNYYERLIKSNKNTVLAAYLQYYLTSDIDTITDMVVWKCTDSNQYVFSYFSLISIFAGILLLIFAISMCFDVAIRIVKLTILRILAPIAIVSYIDPKSSKSGAFASWGKTVATTYLELFVRLAIIYFIIYLTKGIMYGGLYMNSNGNSYHIPSSYVEVLVQAFIIIALFFFAFKAPKFIKKALGIKEESGKLFGGLSSLAGIGISAAGAVGSARANYAGAIKNGQGKLTASLSGVAGGFSGFAQGIKAHESAKDHKIGALLDAQQKRNEQAFKGRTILGVGRNTASSILTGRDKYGQIEKNMEDLQDEIDAQQQAIARKRNDIDNINSEKSKLSAKNQSMSNIMNRADKKVEESTDTTGTHNYVDSYGRNRTVSGNYYTAKSQADAAYAGHGVYKKYRDAAGNEISQAEYDAIEDATVRSGYNVESYCTLNGQEVNMKDLKVALNGLRDENVKDYVHQALSSDDTINDAVINQEIRLLQRLGVNYQYEDEGGELDKIKSDYGRNSEQISGYQNDINDIQEEVNDLQKQINDKQEEIRAIKEDKNTKYYKANRRNNK